MKDETEAGYAKITELSTFSKRTSQVLLIPTRSSKDDAVLEKRGSLPKVPNSARPSIPTGHCQDFPISYRKVSKTEDTRCSHYENVSLSTTTLAKSDQVSSIPAQGPLETGFPQNVSMTPEVEYIGCDHYEALTEPSTSHERREPNRTLYSSAICQQTGSSLTLCKKLEVYRRRLTCFEFICYAMGEVYKEVEQNAVLDAVFCFFSIGILIVGFLYLDGCKACPQIPTLIVCSGIMDSVANTISFGMAIKSNCRNCFYFRDIVRAIRSVMLIAHICGLVLIYKVLYPEEANKSSASYCNSYLYWIGFAYFHIIMLSTVATLAAMIIVSLFYYLSQKNKYVLSQICAP